MVLMVMGIKFFYTVRNKNIYNAENAVE